MTIECPLMLKVHFLDLAGLVPFSCFLTDRTVIPHFRTITFPWEEHCFSGKSVLEDSNSLRSCSLMEHELNTNLKSLWLHKEVSSFPFYFLLEKYGLRVFPQRLICPSWEFSAIILTLSIVVCNFSFHAVLIFVPLLRKIQTLHEFSNFAKICRVRFRLRVTEGGPITEYATIC